jgi:putative glutamine amidotransferase
VPQWYVDVVREAGADVVLLPPVGDPSVLDRLDGLVLIGGADVDAAHYGAQAHETADTPRIERDAWELALYRGARERGLPVLGICRGLQLMAIAHGGTLVQHLPDLDGTAVHRDRPGDFVDHDARVEPGTRLAALMGAGAMRVNSSHHQAVDDPGDLVVSARAEDGSIEALEDPSTAFCLGVQWHPEHPSRRDADAAIMAAFVTAADAYASATTG